MFFVAFTLKCHLVDYIREKAESAKAEISDMNMYSKNLNR